MRLEIELPSTAELQVTRVTTLPNGNVLYVVESVGENAIETELDSEENCAVQV